MLDNASTGSAQNTLATKTLAKMSQEDLDELAAELDLIRDDILNTLGKDDAEYLRRLLKIQRGLDVAGRITLLAGLFPPAWFAGVGLLALAKILENMEIAHNVMHGQWDWMRDPDIHSTTWEWDNVCPSEQWRHSHNYLHHQWTNVDGMDKDIGYGIFRVHESQEWRPEHLAQPAIFVILAVLFEYGISLHDNDGLHFGSGKPVDLELARPKLHQTWEKIRSQAAKDFVWFPLMATPLGLPSVVAAATGAAAANVIRNVWSFSVIFCGHFPDGVAVFTQDEVENETRGGWYFRQILGSANFTGGSVINVLSGNLNHQIEHHLYPDLPSNRYAEIAPKVEAICERRGIPYNTGSFVKQLGSVVNKIVRLSVPFGK
ncbi:MAG: acyl-CoA desaturase [Microthrixaceae bacterium]